ncbi:unnamed protein product [Paramecium sonneborni]|uniref:Uncharacterized protein n=1 Tax=Paramecium sonneborni TaxID=65129 RepID=A0A8S1PDV6_9CILI|nr:unnamed protein product [Paramecium sonneborni]
MEIILIICVFVTLPKIMNENAYLGSEASKTLKNILQMIYQHILCNFQESPIDTESCEQVIELQMEMVIVNGILQQYQKMNFYKQKHACIRHGNLGCQFSIINDRCIEAQTDVSCTNFESTGMVSSTVEYYIFKITQDKQMYKFDESFKCAHQDDVMKFNIMEVIHLLVIIKQHLLNKDGIQNHQNVIKIKLKFLFQVVMIIQIRIYFYKQLKNHVFGIYLNINVIKQSNRPSSFNKIQSGSEFNKQTSMTQIGDSYYYNILIKMVSSKSLLKISILNEYNTINIMLINKLVYWRLKRNILLL